MQRSQIRSSWQDRSAYQVILEPAELVGMVAFQMLCKAYREQSEPWALHDFLLDYGYEYYASILDRMPDPVRDVPHNWRQPRQWLKDVGAVGIPAIIKVSWADTLLLRTGSCPRIQTLAQLGGRLRYHKDMELAEGCWLVPAANTGYWRKKIKKVDET